MNIVEQINDAVVSRIATILSSPWAELKYTINPAKNDFKSNAKRYGVRPLSGAVADGVTNYYTMDHDFEVCLTHDYIPSPVGDQDQKDKTFLLYDKMDDIFRDLFCSKAGLNSIILNIGDLNIEEPEYSVAESVVLLKATVTIKYRQALL